MYSFKLETLEQVNNTLPLIFYNYIFHLITSFMVKYICISGEVHNSLFYSILQTIVEPATLGYH
ncbi:unnamed protein product [Nezara viridula]|uniref:Uncharacterized protein n=1 Tax=Nezara viridula TaxID=85310 RepID=A0A9P0HFQ8_NEZVI|nr:unnamed protein product [Nezara viridula]